jgi:hypothetical protein
MFLLDPGSGFFSIPDARLYKKQLFRVSDPDSTFLKIADPDPVPDPGYVKKKLQLKFYFLFEIRNCNLLISRPQ